MKFGMGGLTKALTVGAEFTTLQAVTLAVNQMQNIPPIARFIANATLQFASYEIMSKALKNLPPSVKGVAGIAMKMQIVLAGVQMIPAIMSLITWAGSSGNPLAMSSTPMGGQPLPLVPGYP